MRGCPTLKQDRLRWCGAGGVPTLDAATEHAMVSFPPRGPRDPMRVDLNDSDEVTYWVVELGCTPTPREVNVKGKEELLKLYPVEVPVFRLDGDTVSLVK